MLERLLRSPAAALGIASWLVAALATHAVTAGASTHRPHGAHIRSAHLAASLSRANIDFDAGTDALDRETLLDADDARYLLTRTGFAPDEQALNPYVGISREQAVDKLLATARTVPAAPMPGWVDEPIPTRAKESALDADARRAESAERGRRYEALRGWWIHEMATTPSPLTERMTLFWHGHFTSGQDKVPYPQLMARQNQLLRRYALGSFADMLHAVAKDPAMLLYLDGASNRKGHPNENFAREVMELFTLGEGHYTQRDVSEAARAYTGWSLDPDAHSYVWRADWHDAGEKTVLGHVGAFDGDAVLDLLLAQPQTATFIVTELWREFVSDTLDPAQIALIAGDFRASGYNIAIALHALFLTDAFWDARNRAVLVKSPAQFVVGMLRTFDVDDDDMTPLAGTMRNLGQNLFAPPNVKGWPGGPAWVDSSTLLAREQFVEQLFRSTGPKATMRPVSVMAAPGKAMPAHGMRFDLDGWLARYGTAPTERSGLSTELQLQHAVLPISPIDPIEPGTSSAAYLRALLMDPAYQLD
jgi:uncharacterized protein (DUF1800 family)